MKWDVPQDEKEAAAGALLVLGAMLYEWKLPIGKAIRGLREAYKMARLKNESRGSPTHSDAGTG